MEKYKEQAKQYFEKDANRKYMYVSDSGQFFYEEVDASYFISKSKERVHEIKREDLFPVEDVEKPKKIKK